MLNYPAPLRPGARIAVTAPSSGAEAKYHARLDLALGHLRARGFEVVEGQCLRNQVKDASGTKVARAADLWRFLTDPTIAAIYPPWGGERAIEVLDLIDFEHLRTVPAKWLIGFSDTSTVLAPLTLISGWATAHASCLMELVPLADDALTAAILPALGTPSGGSFTQHSSPQYQVIWADYAATPDAPLNLTETTHWKRLDGSSERVVASGRLIGGCIETLSRLAGTRYGDVPGFVRRSAAAGTILYLENAEYKPTELLRALRSLRFHGWFAGLRGLLVGRNAATAMTDPTHANYGDVLAAALGDLPAPVLYDVDIGHRPPQFTLINGALATVTFAAGKGTLVQSLV
jgi:muramoyltetrapeptide carboxypeptidase